MFCRNLVWHVCPKESAAVTPQLLSVKATWSGWLAWWRLHRDDNQAELLRDNARLSWTVATHRGVCRSVRSISLTHWGRVTHICVSKLTIIGSDNGLSPERRQAIIWTNAGILLIGPLGTNFSEIVIEIQTFALKKIRLKMSSAKCCLFRLGLHVLMSFQKELTSMT